MEQTKKPNDILICKTCGEKYTRSNKYNHNKSKIHKKFESLNEDIRYFIINKPEKNPKKIITSKELKFNIAKNNIINLI